MYIGDISFGLSSFG